MSLIKIVNFIHFKKIEAIWHYHPIFLQNFPIGFVQPIFFEAFGPHEAPKNPLIAGKRTELKKSNCVARH